MIANGPSILRQARRGAARFNYLAGVVAGRTPQIIGMMQVGVSYTSGSARLAGR